jgi:EmrB/QacA subfamily drug resistance transporter
MDQTSSALPEKSQRYAILVAVGIATFMGALDASVVNVVLPVIRADFATGIDMVQWAVVVYLLVISGFLLTFGRLGDLRGHKDVYLVGFGIFGAASILCGLSDSALTLTIWRGVQAVGGAMLVANSPAILTKNFPAAQRGRALGLQATMTYLGLVTGPSLGGWLTDMFSWRAVFFINVPVVVVAFLLALRFVPRDRGKAESAEPFDLPGALLYSTGLVLLLLALNQAHNWGWLSALTLGLLIAAALLLVGFVLVENRSAHPMLDLTLFRRLNFSAASTSAVLNYIGIYSIIFVMPFYLIQGRSLSPSVTGILLTSQPLIMMVAAPLSGWLSDRIGTRLPAILGMLIMSAGMFMLSRLGPETPQPYIAVSLAVAGLGTGIFISPNSSALMGAAPRARQGIAAGVMGLSRSLGMVLGVGIAGAILTTVSGAAAEVDAGLFSATQIIFLTAMGAALLSAVSAYLRKDETHATQ